MNLLREEVNQYVSFLVNHNLTADQFLYCVLLSSEASGYQNLPDRETAVANFYKYYETVAKHKENEVWTKQDLDDLLNKELIQRIASADQDSYVYQDFEVTTKFLDIAYQKKSTSMSQFQDFWSEYPARYVSDDGTKFNIKAVNKEEMYKVWRKATNHVDHEDLLQALRIAKSKDEVDCRIDKWLNGHQWEPYMDQVEEDVDPEDNPDIEQTVL